MQPNNRYYVHLVWRTYESKETSEAVKHTFVNAARCGKTSLHEPYMQQRRVLTPIGGRLRKEQLVSYTASVM